MAVRTRKPLPRKPKQRRLSTRGVSVAYRRILVPVVAGHESEQAVALASRLAAEHRASVTVVTVIEVPPELPLEAHMIDEEAEARRVLDEARALAERYGLSVEAHVVRDRRAGAAIVEEARAARAEIVVLRAPRKKRAAKRAPMFGRTVRFVLKNAPCRVMVATLPNAPSRPV